jgi:hypothetical protein
VFEDLKIGSDTIHLDKGDEIILFTDGITEAQNSARISGLSGWKHHCGLRYPNPERPQTAFWKLFMSTPRVPPTRMTLHYWCWIGTSGISGSIAEYHSR